MKIIPPHPNPLPRRGEGKKEKDLSHEGMREIEI